MKISNFLDIKSLLLKNNNLKQTIFKNTFWLSLSEGATKILKLFLMIYVVRILGVTEYGKFTFALSFVSMLAVSTDLGISSLITREIAREKEKEEDFPFILSLKLILSLITLVLIVVGSFFLTPNNEIRKLILVLGVYIAANSFAATFYSFFRAKEKMEYESFTKLFQSIVVTVVSLFILFNFPSVLNLSFSYLFASLGAFLLICLIFHSRINSIKFYFDVTKWKSILTLSIPIGLSEIFTVAYNTAGILMMGYYGQITQLGWYSASLRVTDVILVIIFLISTSFFPVLGRTYRKSKEELQKVWNLYIKIIISLVVPLIVGGISLAPQIIYFVYDPSYTPSVLVLRILILFIGISFVSTPFSQILFIFNQQKKIFRVALFGLILNVVLNLIFLPVYSLYGAAVSLMVTYFLMFLLLFRYLLKLTTIKPFNLELILLLIGSIIASGLMLIILRFAQIYNLHVLFDVIIGIIVYSIFLLGYQKIISKIL